ncbi:hypothetical protein [Bradyrhizobium sp. S3.2.6]|uniref:hypothetical protein n=1 Tax=Bradyrhizobium sp. S3.2.6 TaxID=3156428 RepID=UPI00339282BC
MPKRTPPSDDIPLARRCAFGAQPEAYQPTGNGISGQTRQLSLAALADFSWGGLAIGVGGDKTIVRCKCANCKFMIIDLRSQSFEKMELEINRTRASETAHAFSNRACILGKIGRRFNRQGGGLPASKVDRLG